MADQVTKDLMNKWVNILVADIHSFKSKKKVKHWIDKIQRFTLFDWEMTFASFYQDRE